MNVVGDHGDRGSSPPPAQMEFCVNVALKRVL